MNFFQEFRSEIKTLLIVALVAVAIAIAGILLLQVGLGPSSPPPTPRDQAELDFAGWQTYRNDEYGFEVRYPNNWFNTTDKERNTIYYDAEAASFQIDIHSDFALFQELMELSPGGTSGQLPGVVYTKTEDLIIDGFPAVRYRGDYSAIPAGVLPRSDEVLMQKEGSIFHFVLMGKSPEAIKENIKVFDQILATFRFTE